VFNANFAAREVDMVTFWRLMLLHVSSTVVACRLQNERCIFGTTSIYWAWSARTWQKFCRSCLLRCIAPNSTGTSMNCLLGPH